MKAIFISLALVCAAGARADLVMQQQIVTPDETNVATIKVKGTKVRLDLYAGLPRAISTIKDLKTGDTITLLHNQKMFIKTSGEPGNQTRSAANGATANSLPKSPTPRPTGKTQKVGDYDTELYEWSNARGITGTTWVAKNFPDYARMRADIVVLDKIAGADNDTTPEISALPGMAVRSQVTGGSLTIIAALISAKEEPIAASLFQIPTNYKEFPRPKPFVNQTPPQKATDNSKASGNAKASGGSKTSGRSKASDGSKAPPGNFTMPKVPSW